MPMLDAYIPEGALEPNAEAQLVAQLTDILLEWEGADPSSEMARSIAWVFLHRPAEVFVGGKVPELPRYRIVASVPEGQLDARRRQGMVAAVTEAVLDAEPDGRPRDPYRVWVFAGSIPEGTWGGGGNIVGLADIVAFVRGGDAAAGQAHAKRKLAAVKAERDAIFS
jgi:phenylpyruvate tautomerase PptA (4-oxalocrotonate tautomerase family)